MAELKVVDALLAMANAPPPATLICVRSESACTFKRLVPASVPVTKALSTRARVSMLLKLLTTAPAPAMENGGGVLAPASPLPSPPAPSFLPDSVPRLSTVVVAASSSAFMSSAFSARPEPGGLVPSPAAAPATPTAAIMPSLLACTFSRPVAMAPTAPSAVLPPPPSASLSPT